MELKELMEKITMDIVLEGCGLICSLTILNNLFLGGGIRYFIEIMGIALCG